MIELRPAQSRHLRQRLQAFQDGFRHNLALLAPSGAGKTALVETALRSEGLRLPVIHCQLQREPLRDFSRRLTAAVVHAAKTCAPHPLPATQAAIEQVESLATQHASTELFMRTLDVIAAFQQEQQQSCVLVLDEFLRLEELGLSQAFHELGKRVMTWSSVLFVLTSSSPHRARHILQERLHLLFGQFEIVPLGPVEPAPALKWMQHELSTAKRYEALMRFLLHWIGASPWPLHMLLDRMKELHVLTKSPGVSRSEVAAKLSIRERSRTKEGANTVAPVASEQAPPIFLQAAWDVLGRPEGALHQWCARRIERVLDQPDGPLAREALVAVANGCRTTQAVTERCGTRRRVPEVLQLLVEHDLIERKGACWVMPDQLLACWLTAVLWPRLHQAQDRGAADRAGTILAGEEMPRTAGGAAQAELNEAMNKRWFDWVATAQEPFAQRISRLLKQFRNETVSLDSKTGRLPLFEDLTLTPTPQPPVTYVVADGEERRWCCLVHDGLLQEQHVAEFERFCRTQLPKPSRKVVVAKDGLELNAKLLAKNANMWVWEPTDLNLLCLLYGQSPF